MSSKSNVVQVRFALDTKAHEKLRIKAFKEKISLQDLMQRILIEGAKKNANTST